MEFKDVAKFGLFFASLRFLLFVSHVAIVAFVLLQLHLRYLRHQIVREALDQVKTGFRQHLVLLKAETQLLHFHVELNELDVVRRCVQQHPQFL